VYALRAQRWTDAGAGADVDLDGVNLDAEEWAGDINTVASVMKLWFRELPEPLLTNTLHLGFLEAASAFSPSCPLARASDPVRQVLTTSAYDTFACTSA
jgi:hypothetical protein